MSSPSRRAFSSPRVRDALAGFGLPVHFPSLQYCTDNAAMTAGLADVLLQSGQTASLDLDAITSSARYSLRQTGINSHSCPLAEALQPISSSQFHPFIKKYL